MNQFSVRLGTPSELRFKTNLFLFDFIRIPFIQNPGDVLATHRLVLLLDAKKPRLDTHRSEQAVAVLDQECDEKRKDFALILHLTNGLVSVQQQCLSL